VREEDPDFHQKIIAVSSELTQPGLALGPQDVEMPEEDAANAVKLPKELDNLTLDGRIGS
jgi:hypothetical protein